MVPFLVSSPFRGLQIYLRSDQNHNLTRCVRLCDSFTCAITTILHFIETGNYMFSQRASTEFLLLTMSDFNIRAGLASSKYSIAALQECAINASLNIAEH